MLQYHSPLPILFRRNQFLFPIPLFPNFYLPLNVTIPTPIIPKDCRRVLGNLLPRLRLPVPVSCRLLTPTENLFCTTPMIPTSVLPNLQTHSRSPLEQLRSVSKIPHLDWRKKYLRLRVSSTLVLGTRETPVPTDTEVRRSVDVLMDRVHTLRHVFLSIR